MSAPIGGGGGGGAGAVLGGAGPGVSIINPREISFPLLNAEATSPEWDSFQLGSAATPIAANTNVNGFAPGQGTWLIELVVEGLFGAQATWALNVGTGAVATRRTLDFCSTAQTGERRMRAVIALGKLDQVSFDAISGTVAVGSVSWCFFAKRITR